jgi:hypothetical protein
MILLALISFSCSGPETSESIAANQDSPTPNAEVVSLLEEFIAAQEIEIKRLEVFMQEGLASPGHVSVARASLADFRIELAERLGQHDVVVEQLEYAVTVLGLAVKEVKLKMDLGAADYSEHFEINRQLLRTQIRLAEAKAVSTAG